MYEVLIEKSRGPFGLFKQMVKLGDLNPNEFNGFRRRNEVGIEEVVEVRIDPEGDILDISADSYPLKTVSLKDFERLRPTVVSTIDIGRPIRSSRPIVVVESFDIGSQRLILARKDVADYITGSSNTALEAALLLVGIVKRGEEAGRVYEDRHMDEVFCSTGKAQ